MANKILVLGNSGSGKSVSMQNLDPATTWITNVIGKQLPFRGWKSKYTMFDRTTKEGNMVAVHSHDEVIKSMEYAASRPEIKTIVVDDAQYIMSYEFMARAKEQGWTKFSDIAQHMFDVLICPDKLRDDLTVIFLSHSEEIVVDGKALVKMKTIGKMLDDKITIEGLFTIVLLCVSYKNTESEMEYVFVTKSNGTNPAKTPMGMFKEITIPNDLKAVLDRVEEYNNE